MDPADERAPLDALPLLSRALSYEESLRRRTEGLTWAIWGLVFALVFFMYAGVGETPVPGFLLNVLWVGWVLVGSALTWALWRTSALRLAGEERRPAGAWVTLAWLGAIGLGFFLVVEVAPPPPNPESTGLVAVGVAWLAMGATNLVRATPSGRATVVAIGALLLVGGLATAFLLPAPDWSRPEGDATRFLHDLLRGAVAGLVPVALGLRQALRG